MPTAEGAVLQSHSHQTARIDTTASHQYSQVYSSCNAFSPMRMWEENAAGSNCGLHDEFSVLGQGNKGICSGLMHDVPSHGGAYRSSTTVPAQQQSISLLNADTENLKCATAVTANAMPDGKDTIDTSLYENADSEMPYNHAMTEGTQYSTLLTYGAARPGEAVSFDGSTVHAVVADRSSNATPVVDHIDERMSLLLRSALRLGTRSALEEWPRCP